jgi:hypothetical protein
MAGARALREIPELLALPAVALALAFIGVFPQ